MKKGQMFLAGAIVLVVGMILLKLIMGTYEIAEEKRHQDSFIADRQIKNIKEQYENLINNALINNRNDIQTHLSNFSNYLRSEFPDRIKILYMMAIVNTDRDTNITIGNFLDDKINVTIAAKNFVLNDQTQSSNLFSFDNITLRYQYRNDNITEVMKVDYINATYVFFDIIVGSDSFVRTKYVYNRTY